MKKYRILAVTAVALTIVACNPPEPSLKECYSTVLDKAFEGDIHLDEVEHYKTMCDMASTADKIIEWK